MDSAAAGQKALDAKDFQGAIQHFTKAVAAHPKAVDYYIKRSTAYTRLSPPNNLLSLLDAETAVVLARERGKRELIGQAQLRRGVALFGSERYADAGQCFEWAKELLPKDNSLGMWKARVEAKQKDLPYGDDRGEVRVKKLPDVDMDGIMKKAADDKESKDEKIEATAASDENTADTKAPAETATPAHKIRHEWYQSAETVTVTLLAKGVDKEKATIDIQAGSLSISFPLATGSDYDFSIDPFYAAIDPSTSKSKIMSTKIEIILKKAQPGQKWHSLEGSTPIAAAEGTSGENADQSIPKAVVSGETPSGPAYPTSSKHGPKNWDKVAADLTKKPKKDKGEDADADAEKGYESDDGGDPVNSFFKKIYANANEDTRRAMMKSFQESNGTALSTNWEEVKKGPVETSPPEGMEAKKW